MRLAGLASLTVLLAGLAVVVRYHGYDHAVATLTRSFAVAFGQDGLVGDVSYERIVEVILLRNGGIDDADVVVQPVARRPGGGDLGTAHAALADAAPTRSACRDLPPSCSLRWRSRVTSCPASVGVAVRVPAAALGILFVFEGLAAAHVLTRGVVARRTILAAVYLTTVFLLPWPLLALVVLGCIDCFASLRGFGIKISKQTRS